MPVFRHTKRCGRYSRHGNARNPPRPMRQPTAAQLVVAPPSPHRRDVDMPSGERRKSFEDFANLDQLVAEMTNKVNIMAQILRDAGRLAEASSNAPTSRSSVNQALLLAPVFDAIQPLMSTMFDDVSQGIRLFDATPPPAPDPRLLRETAEAMAAQFSDGSLLRKLVAVYSPCSDWDGFRRVRILPCCQKDVMSFMRILSVEDPEHFPQFPAETHIGNSYMYCSSKGVYFFAQGFLAFAARRPPASSKLGQFFMVDSDTDDDSDTD